MKSKLLSVLLLSTLILVLTGCGSKGVVVKDELDLEINSEVKISSLISEENELEIINKDELVDTSNLGEKEVTIRYKDNDEEKEQVIKVNVVDTTGPIIEYNKELVTTEGVEIDLLAGVKVSDNSKKEITAAVAGEYDINTAGNYNLKYVAVDSSDNKTEEEFMLIVKKLPTLTLGKTYYNKDLMHNGSSLSEITLNSDKSVKVSAGGINAGSTNYTGSFTISGTTLTITLNKYQDVDGSWSFLPEKEQRPKEYTITDDNTFSDSTGVYVVK